MSKNSDILLSVRGLGLSFQTFESGVIRVLDGVDLDIRRGETVGLVGESGSGKSVTAMSIMRLLEEPPAILDGEIVYHGADRPVDILKLARSGNKMRSIRGDEIAMIFQEPMRALSPVFTVGHQVAEAVRLHRNESKREARKLTIDMLDRVGLANPDMCYGRHPHELSGGQRQRVMIAMALVCQPKLLIADEPTTALDVTIQAQILELLSDLQRQFNLAVLLITHDLGIIAQTCRKVNVMYLGKIVESADVKDLYAKPAHPYTRGLLSCVPVPGRGHRQRLQAIEGTVPEPTETPVGCGFGPRCSSFQKGICDKDAPVPVKTVREGHTSRCYMTKGQQAPPDEETIG